jgi:hypothetical protein
MTLRSRLVALEQQADASGGCRVCHDQPPIVEVVDGVPDGAAPCRGCGRVFVIEYVRPEVRA